MKLADLEKGKTYWYSTRNDWDAYEYVAYDRHPVRVESLDRYRYSPPRYSQPKGWTPDQSARKDPKGRFIRVIIPGEPDAQYESQRVDRPAYIDPKYIRAELGEFRRIVAAKRKALDDARKAEKDRADAAKGRRDVLRARAEAIGLGGVIGIEIGRSGRPAGALGEADLEGVLDRLEQAEARERAAFLEGLRLGLQEGALAGADYSRSSADDEAMWVQYRARKQAEGR